MTNNLNDSYVFATKEGSDKSYVKILDGPLLGAVIDIKNVNIPTKPDKRGQFRIKINYEFIEPPSSGENLTPNEIDHLIGIIVSDILENHIYK